MSSCKYTDTCDCTDIEPKKRLFGILPTGLRNAACIVFNKNLKAHKLRLHIVIIKREFWFGNDNIHDLTKLRFAPKKFKLLIDMRMKEANEKVYIKYNAFEIRNEESISIFKNKWSLGKYNL